MAAKRNTYDTLVIMLFILGQEKLLPPEFVAQIPYSTRDQWRGLRKEKFIGHQFRDDFQSELKRIVRYQKYRHLKKVLSTVEELFISLASFFELVRLKLHEMKSYRETVCDLISKFSSVISAEKLREVFHISKATHQRWLFEIKSKCNESLTGFCFKSHPNQLSRPQIAIIKKFLTDPEFFHWPVNSIALYCLREKILCCCVATWYHYRKLLGIHRPRHKHKDKKEGLKSTKPNEFWHMDVTKIVTYDKVLHYVYMLIDNFSKIHLARRRETFLSMEVNRNLVRIAYNKAKTIENPINVKLVVDGGSENNNHVVENFILSTTGEINKLKALKDIDHSNSAVEATFKTLKSWYLPPKALQNGDTLDAYLNWFEDDFCNLRPNANLKGYTPAEVYYNKKPDFDFASDIREASVTRREFNRNDCCKNNS